MFDDFEEAQEEAVSPGAKISFTSYSRLGAYLTCSEQFKLRYVDKVPYPRGFVEHFALGQLCHSILEEVLDPRTLTTDPIDAACIHLPGWLNNIGLQEPEDLEELLDFGLGLAELLYRASSRCKENCIRNKDGSLPKDPIEFPPAPFADAMSRSGLASKKLEYDNWAALLNSEFTQTSFSWLLGRAIFMTKYFSTPDWIERTLHVELPFSTEEANLVKLPGVKPISADYFHGKIDWVVETKTREVAILDHKTGKEMPDPQTVLHSPQLNLYGFAYRELYGVWPELIGINHLLTGQTILAALDKEIATSIAKYYRDLQDASASSVYVRRSPVEYKTPCIKRDWKTKRITETCPYLSNCWPIYVETLTY